LGIVLIARADGSFARLKACPHKACGWAFYDISRNRSSQWCSMRICGNRTKGEVFRRRRTRRAA
jgi:predicted RNA-binding Zn ribbon-like protein